MRRGKLLGVFGAGVLLSALVMTLALGRQAWAGPLDAGSTGYVTASGSFTAETRVRIHDGNGPCDDNFKVYGYSYSGTIMSKGGVRMTIYRCKYKGKPAMLASDLVVAKSTMTIRNGVTFKGKFLFTAQKGYCYYFWLVPAVSGRTGTYKIVMHATS